MPNKYPTLIHEWFEEVWNRRKHEGDGLGIQATQKETKFTGMCIARVKNGKFVEAWNNFDFLTMHTQLGS